MQRTELLEYKPQIPDQPYRVVVGEAPGKLTPQQKISYTDVDTAFGVIQLDDNVFFQGGDNTIPLEAQRAVKRRSVKLKQLSGRTDRPVFHGFSTIHTQAKEHWGGELVDQTVAFGGNDVSEELRLGELGKGGHVRWFRDKDGGIGRLEQMKDRIWGGKPEDRTDVLVVSVSEPIQIGNETFLSLGTCPAGPVDILNRERWLRAHQEEAARIGAEPLRIVAVKDKNIPPVTQGNVLLHENEITRITEIDAPIPAHPEAKERPELTAIANNIGDGVDQALSRPENQDCDVIVQIGFGPLAKRVAVRIAAICKKQGREVTVFSEVICPPIDKLLADEMVRRPVYGSATLDMSEYMSEHPEDFVMNGTGETNSVEAMSAFRDETFEQINEERAKKGLPLRTKKPFVVTVNQATLGDVLTGDVSAAEKQVYNENGEVVGVVPIKGHGGQGVFTEIGRLFGASFVGIQSRRELGNGVVAPGLALSTLGAKVTSLGSNITHLATEQGLYENLPLTGDPKKDEQIKMANLKGRLGIAAPDVRGKLTIEARAKGLLPAKENKEATLYPTTPLEFFARGFEQGVIYSMKIYAEMMKTALGQRSS